MLANYALLMYIVYDHLAALDVYEFIYWPFFSCCFNKKKKEIVNGAGM